MRIFQEKTCGCLCVHCVCEERERERERAAPSEHWIQREREREVRLGWVRLNRLRGRALRLGRPESRGPRLNKQFLSL